MSHITSTIKITHQGDKEDFDSFCEFINSLVNVIDNTVYQVEIVEEKSEA